MKSNVILYKLLLACPSDIIEEIVIIDNVIREWNKTFGNIQNKRIEMLHWSRDSYPEYGDRPQALLNKQLLINADIVMGVFWTHFGSPTGEADSGTEEEIKRGISLKKEILVYFCNRPIAPNNFDKAQHDKIIDFKKDFGKSGLYWEYDTLDKFENDFRRHLNISINNIKSHPQFQLNETLKSNSMKKKKKIEKVKKEYIATDRIKKLISDNFNEYFNDIFSLNIGSELAANSSIVFKQDKDIQHENMLNKINEWETDITGYSNGFKRHFNIDTFESYKIDYTSFKNNVFAKEHWTVNSALKTPDLELIRYRAAFSSVTGKEIFDVVKRIIEGATTYAHETIQLHKQILDVKDLNFEFLNSEEMLLSGVIGLGVRSELLHRLYPTCFAIMTRRSIWGMYFLAGKSADFIREETDKDNRYRVSHEWEYDYERFTYYSNYVSILLEEKLKSFGINLKSSIWYGYSARLLNDISQKYDSDIDYYLEWKTNGR